MWKEGKERPGEGGLAAGRRLKLHTGFGRAAWVQGCLTVPRGGIGDDCTHLRFWSCGQLGRYRPRGRWAGWTESTRWSPPRALAPPSRCYGDPESVLRLLGVASPGHRKKAGHWFKKIHSNKTCIHDTFILSLPGNKSYYLVLNEYNTGLALWMSSASTSSPL